MKLAEFNYNLPKKLIAQTPKKPRDLSRLLVLDKEKGKIEHKHFYDLPKYLKKGDTLVMNNSKVIPARLWGRKETGGKIEVLLLNKINDSTWECLLGGKGRRKNLNINFDKEFVGKVITEKTINGIWKIKFNKSGKELSQKIKKIGETPTPPYIKKKSNLTSYQTVYAKHEGSVAAPTAGLHFTKRLLRELKDKGVKIEFVTLHVGLGTFQPVRVENIEEHKMHAEFASLDKDVASRLNKIKKEKNGRIIAAGTTSARVLESFCKNNKLTPQSDWIDLFIYPGYKFKFVDCLITNFHLPKSTLLMLVSAFASKELIFKAYKEAIKKKYRFYSFGDAMLIKKARLTNRAFGTE